ncbi:hypothetical protein ACJX0J_029159 [Zea mays]
MDTDIVLCIIFFFSSGLEERHIIFTAKAIPASSSREEIVFFYHRISIHGKKQLKGFIVSYVRPHRFTILARRYHAQNTETLMNSGRRKSVLFTGWVWNGIEALALGHLNN